MWFFAKKKELQRLEDQVSNLQAITQRFNALCDHLGVDVEYKYDAATGKGGVKVSRRRLPVKPSKKAAKKKGSKQ